jgi:hypothetical protein
LQTTDSICLFIYDFRTLTTALGIIGLKELLIIFPEALKNPKDFLSEIEL